MGFVSKINRASILLFAFTISLGVTGQVNAANEKSVSKPSLISVCVNPSKSILRAAQDDRCLGDPPAKSNIGSTSTGKTISSKSKTSITVETSAGATYFNPSSNPFRAAQDDRPLGESTSSTGTGSTSTGKTVSNNSTTSNTTITKNSKNTTNNKNTNVAVTTSTTTAPQRVVTNVAVTTPTVAVTTTIVAPTTTTPTNTTTTAPTNTTTTTTTSSSTTTNKGEAGSFAGYLGGTCPDGSGIPWYWGSGGQSRAGGCSAAASIAPISTGSSGSAATTTTVAPVVVPGTPATPTGVSGNAQVTVSVTAGSGGTPTSYTITKSTSSTGTYTTGCTVTGASGSCVVTGLTNGTTYFFKTTATNSAGTSGLSAASSSVRPATVPGSPTIGTATVASATSVTVACTAPGSNGGATITTYTATAVGTSITGTLTSATCSSAITVTGLTTGTAYTFTVTATNSAGTSVASAASNSVTPAVTVPGAPTIGTATNAGPTSVTVACTTPASNGFATITTYTFTSSPGGITATLTSATCTTTTVTGLTTGTAYTFTVTATNSVGTSLASAASNSATTAVTCAAGGACIVGNTGPGGGIVFYVQASGGTFTSTGSDCNTECKYLEVATSHQSTAIEWATTAAVCYAAGSDSGSSICQETSIYSNSAGQAASRTAATAIGMGMANTNAIYARVTTAGGAATSAYAAGIAWEFSNNGKTDWHLPSKNELNQMCKWQRGVAWTSDATVCTGGTMNSGTGASGFTTATYWSSSEYDATLRASSQSFSSGTQFTNFKNSRFYVRSVRAFG